MSKRGVKMSDLCPLAVAQDSTEDEYHPETAAESHLLLLKQKKYCDVTFTFPKLPNRVQAHEIYLKARSPVFAKLFRMRKSGNVQGDEIEISESTPEIFQHFLEFIYADKFEVDIPGALDLLHLAQKYKVNPLIKKCEQRLLSSIPLVGSAKVFETARRYGRRELMERAGLIMVKSFVELARIDALANAEEETLIYLLERDDLAVKEVELFQFILDWGGHKVGACGDIELLRKTLKNLLSKIRFTNMTPDEFTKVVVPTGLLSAKETVSVYSYLCGDNLTRSPSNIKFNTICRRMEIREAVTKVVDFCASQPVSKAFFRAGFKHYISFKIDRTQVDGLVSQYSLQKRPCLTAIKFHWPSISNFSRRRVSNSFQFNFNLSMGEHSGAVEEGNFTTRFEKTLLNCKQDHLEEVSVEPPVELMSGRKYSVIVEDISTHGSNYNLYPYVGHTFRDTSREAYVDLKDVHVTFKEIDRSTADDQHLNRSYVLATIQGFSIGLV